MVPAAGSVAVDFVTPASYMHIDAASVEALELIRHALGCPSFQPVQKCHGPGMSTAFPWLAKQCCACMRSCTSRPAKGDGAPARGVCAKAASLFWWLNRTATACGAQLLKVCCSLG